MHTKLHSDFSNLMLNNSDSKLKIWNQLARGISNLRGYINWNIKFKLFFHLPYIARHALNGLKSRGIHFKYSYNSNRPAQIQK